MLAVALIALAACSSEKSILERGGPRIPDRVGIVTDMTLDRIQLDGGRAYEVSEDVESFATRSHHITALLSWEGKYVHVGLDDDDRVRWIAGIGLVSGKPPKVAYSGVVKRMENRRGTFEDGTVLDFESGLKMPAVGREIVVDIDARPNQGQVINVIGGARER